MKKILIATLAIACLSFAMVGCSGGSDNSAGSGATPPTPKAKDSGAATAGATTTPAATAGGTAPAATAGAPTKTTG